MRSITIKSTLKFAIIMVFLVFNSCSDWLSIAPEDKLIKEKFWTKTADVNGALAASYNALRNASLESLIFGELRADLIDVGGATTASYEQIAASNISPVEIECFLIRV